MALTLQATGSTAMVVGSNVTLTTVSTLGIYILEVDPTPLANGEVLTSTILSAAKSGGTQTAADTQSYTGTGAAVTTHLFSSPIPIGSAATFQLKQGNGTARTVDWSLFLAT